jgi:hypothetical protein
MNQGAPTADAALRAGAVLRCTHVDTNPANNQPQNFEGSLPRLPHRGPWPAVAR